MKGRWKVLGDWFKKKEPKTDKQIKMERQKWLNDMLPKATHLKKFVEADEAGWKIFIALVDDYIDKCKKRKAITALDIADDATLKVLKELDHEVFILNFMKSIPEKFIAKVENLVKEEREKEGNG